MKIFSRRCCILKNLSSLSSLIAEISPAIVQGVCALPPGFSNDGLQDTIAHTLPAFAHAPRHLRGKQVHPWIAQNTFGLDGIGLWQRKDDPGDVSPVQA